MQKKKFNGAIEPYQTKPINIICMKKVIICPLGKKHNFLKNVNIRLDINLSWHIILSSATPLTLLMILFCPCEAHQRAVVSNGLDKTSVFYTLYVFLTDLVALVLTRG